MTFAALLRRSVGQSWYLLAGAALLLAGFEVLMVAAAAALVETRADSVFAQIVPAFLRGFGSEVLQIASFRGLIAFGYFHPVIVILLAVIAMYYASEPTHEVESRLVDVVLARPVPRHRVLTRSVALVLVVPVGLALVMALGTQAGLRWFRPPNAEPPTAVTLARLIAPLVAVSWCFGAIALALAAASRRWSVAFATAAFGAILLYLVDFVATSWPLWRNVAWLSPFHYYPALRLLAGTESVVPNLAVLLTATVAFISVAYWQFERRDL